MRIILLLPTESVGRVRAAVGSTLTVVRVATDEELLWGLDRKTVSGVMLDPTLVPEGRVHSLVRQLQESRIPLIVYLSLQRYFVRGQLAGSVKG